MDKLYFCIPTYKSFDLCRKAVDSALAGTRVPDYIIILDNSGSTASLPYLQDIVNIKSEIYLWPQPRNIGVAAAWNLFHKEIQDDFIIIGNDDIELHPHTLEDMVKFAKDHDDWLFGSSNSSGNMFSLFLLKREGFTKIGQFDENFYPAYFEDNDYSYRAKLLGKPLVPIESATYNHVGSSTLKRYNIHELEQHHQCFRANEIYYRDKWCGTPGNEKFTVPFKG